MEDKGTVPWPAGACGVRAVMVRLLIVPELSRAMTREPLQLPATIGCRPPPGDKALAAPAPDGQAMLSRPGWAVVPKELSNGLDPDVRRSSPRALAPDPEAAVPPATK